MRCRTTVSLPLTPSTLVGHRHSPISSGLAIAANHQCRSETIPSVTPGVLASAEFQPPAETPDSGPDCDTFLLQLRQALLWTLADAESAPACCIVQSRRLEELAQRLPTEPHALLQIYGIGEEKA